MILTNMGIIVYRCCIQPAEELVSRERGDMTTSSNEIGAYLAHLREKAGLKQNELASKVTWSPAVLSRVESGERALSAEERDSILDAIATEEALSFKETVERVWEHLPRPPLGHPDEQILWEAEEALKGVKERAERPDTKNVMAKHLEEFSSELSEAARLVLNTQHNIAFVGNIGVGKTTALCCLAGLEVQKDGKSEPTLEVGGGRTTVCEVQVMQGRDYGIFVEPMGMDEIHREVMEFAAFLTGDAGTEPEQEAGEQDAQGTSKEINRVIRNMSGLTTSRIRPPDGKRKAVDLAKNLAEESNNASTLAGEIMARMRLPQRTGRRVWYPETSGKEPPLWLKETFQQINKGLHPDFSMPKRIDITVPSEILGEETLSICLVDTRGIDGTAERTDLEVRFKESGTVMVLCSSFNNAPESELQQLLRLAVAGGVADVGNKAAILALPHPGQALAAKDDQGFPADSVEEGYEFKGDEVEFNLNQQKLPYADIAFFNAIEDDPQKTVEFLLGLVQGVRDKHRAKLTEIIEGATALVHNFDEVEVQEIYQLAARRMLVWLENNQEVGNLALRLEDSLVSAIGRAYASSVRASVRRQGDWYNLDYSYHLGSGARIMTNRVTVPKLDSFKAITENLLQDDELEPAFGLIRQARRILEDDVDTLLLRSELLGRRIYIQYMEPDSVFWRWCDDQWGRGYVDGLGYRDRVARHNRNWFSDNDQDFQAMAQELVEREWRQILGRLAAILDPEEIETVAA